MTFSNPRYDVMQTAPYQTENNGHPISAACVGAVSPVEEGATLAPADDLIPPPVVPPNPGPINIGTVTINTSNPNPTVGDTVIYTATHSGSATDIVDTFSAPGETFTGGTVTWANDGLTTVTCKSTSATAVDSPRQGSLQVNVAAAGGGGGGGGGTVSFTSFTSSSISDGQTLSANSAYHFNGSPNGCSGSNISPQLSWAVDDDTNVSTYNIAMTDITSPWLHWDVVVPKTVTTMAEGFDVAAAGGTVNENHWESSGITGSATNGYGGPCPPGGQHNYRIQIFAVAADDSLLASSGTIDFTA